MSPLSCPQVCTDLQVAVSANWLHSPSRLCHREGAFTQFTFQNGQESRKWLTIQICHVLNAWEAKKPLYGTKNLSKGAKTRVRVLADIQNFALRAHCVRTACALRAWHSLSARCNWLSAFLALSTHRSRAQRANQPPRPLLTVHPKYSCDASDSFYQAVTPAASTLARATPAAKGPL